MASAFSRWIANLTRIAVMALVCVLILAGSIFLIALGVSWCRGGAVTESVNFFASLVCGLIAWLIIAAFHLRRETLRLSFPDRGPFLKQVEIILGELGYVGQGDSAAGQFYKPTFRSYLFGGRVQVAVEATQGIITGPKFCLELVRRRMRICNHLDNVHQAIQESRRRHGERLLKRVQLSLRFSPEHWPVIQQLVLEPLDLEAEVVCDLNVLAQSDAGICENTVELQVRSWLTAQGIHCQIRKELLQREEPVKQSLAPALANGVPA
jgi:hypothetical protein